MGPLAAASLAFGIVVGEGEGVWGERVAYTQFEGPDSCEIHLDDEARAARAAEASDPAAAYYLVATYD